MVYSLVQSGLPCITFKIINSIPTMLKCIKQQTLTDFLKQKSYLRRKSLLLTVFLREDTVDISTVHHWGRDSREGGRNVDLNNQPWSGRSVSATQNLKRQDLTKLLKKINSEIYVEPLKRLRCKLVTFVLGSESPMLLQHDNARPHFYYYRFSSKREH